jgi:hypothetical protein
MKGGDDRQAFGIIDLAVDVHRNKFFCRFLDLCKQFPDTCGLSCPGQPLADSIQWPSPAKAGPDLESQFAHLGVPEFELLGNVINLQYLGVAEECFIPHQQVLFHLTNLYAIGINCIGLFPD